MATTLADLILSVRQTANVENNGFFDDVVEMPRIINEAANEVYDLLVTTFAPYFQKDATFTLTSIPSILLTTITTGLPAFYKETGIDFQQGGSLQVQPVIKLDSFSDRYLQVNSDFAGSYTLHYVPSLVLLTNVVNLPDEMDRWRELVELHAAIKCYEKRQKPCDTIRTAYETKKASIISAAPQRMGEPQLIPFRQRRKSRRYWIAGDTLTIYGAGNTGFGPWGFGAGDGDGYGSW